MAVFSTFEVNTLDLRWIGVLKLVHLGNIALFRGCGMLRCVKYVT